MCTANKIFFYLLFDLVLKLIKKFTINFHKLTFQPHFRKMKIGIRNSHN